VQLNLEHVPFDCITRFIEGVAYRRTMEQKSATDVFSQWAIIGKDEGMERGHAPSVKAMLELALPKVKEDFTAIDLGCGNGWVVRRLGAHPLCQHASGVDGAPSMIAKAREVDPKGDYIEAMLPDWKPSEAVDLIHTMECLYYLDEPLEFLHTLHNDWLRPGGRMVIGVDHYQENPSSHDWGPSLNVHMALLSIEEWTDGLEEAGFVDVEAVQVGAKEGWSGTLVITANRRMN